MPQLQPKDLIALTVVIGFFVLVLMDKQTMIPSAVMLILGYYFAKRADKKDDGY